jgi:anti-anti-sigma regulatory factor
MNIEKKIENRAMTISLDGKLDTQSSPELDKVITEALDFATSVLICPASLGAISLLSAMK